jgi:HD-like signal output (HDOD) protein
MNGNKLDQYAKDLKPEKLPAFNQTVQHILSITDREETSAKELTGAILTDPSMTAHVLQIANRVPYNPSAQPIATISQAVLILGFNSIRNLCLTKALIDSIISSDAHTYLKQLITQSLHAAFQAQGLAAVSKLPHEDIFIVTLLKRLGDVALWSLEPQDSDHVAQLISEEGCSLEEAQTRVYGFTGTDLSRRLNQDWKLNELLTDALNPNPSKDARIRCIQSGEELARHYANSEENKFSELMGKLENRHQNLSTEEFEALIEENLDKARKMAGKYNLPASQSIQGNESPEETDEAPADWQEPCGETQLRILGEISELLDGSPNINLLLEMVAEGIYRGIGMDTCFFALLSPDRQSVHVRFVLGHRSKSNTLNSRIAITPGNIIERCLADNQPIWFQQGKGYQLERELSEQCEDNDFFMRSITIGSRAIGLFYTDRASSRRPLTDQDYSSFRLFCQQANLGLAFLKNQ